MTNEDTLATQPFAVSSILSPNPSEGVCVSPGLEAFPAVSLFTNGVRV